MVAGFDWRCRPRAGAQLRHVHRRPAPHGRLVRALRRANHSRLRGKCVTPDYLLCIRFTVRDLGPGTTRLLSIFGRGPRLEPSVADRTSFFPFRAIHGLVSSSIFTVGQWQF